MECHIQFENGVLVHVSAQYFIPYINRFLALYDRLIAGRSAEVRSVDLHYETGLAIQWKKIHSKFKQSLRKV
jgi:cell division septal protein FtsQ